MDFEIEILKLKPNDTFIIKFPIEEYDLNSIHQIYENIKSLVPEGVEVIMMPKDWSIEVESN